MIAPEKVPPESLKRRRRKRRKGAGGARPNAGRKAGIPNKATLRRALEAEARVAEAREPGGRKLAKDVLDEFMHLFAGMAAHYQPLPPGVPVPPQRQPDEDKFEKYARLTVETATALVGYQSPRFKAILSVQDWAPIGAPAQVPDGSVERMSAQETYRAMKDATSVITQLPAKRKA